MAGRPLSYYYYGAVVTLWCLIERNYFDFYQELDNLCLPFYIQLVFRGVLIKFIYFLTKPLIF